MKTIAFFTFLAVFSASPAQTTAFGQPLDGQKGAVDYSKGYLDVVFVPDDVEMLEEKMLPIDYGHFEFTAEAHRRGAKYRSNPGGIYYSPKGMRMFAIILQPGETIRIALQGTLLNGYHINWLLPPDRSDPFYSRIKLAFNANLSQKRPVLSFQNTTPAPYEASFFLEGPANKPYSIILERGRVFENIRTDPISNTAVLQNG